MRALLFLYVVSACGFPSCFCFNDPPTTDIYTLSLHDALPISAVLLAEHGAGVGETRVERARPAPAGPLDARLDRKSTRLNSSHRCISYAVFCLKKKKTKLKTQPTTRQTQPTDASATRYPSTPT